MNAFQVLNHFSENPSAAARGGGLFFLCGFKTHRITAFSQQNRAVSLVEALVATGEISVGTNIGILGGGVAGITAAYWAACHGAKVTVYEQGEDILRMYVGANHRRIHPGLFNWPRSGWDIQETNLPCLNWSFKDAHSVGEELRARVTPFLTTSRSTPSYRIHVEKNVGSVSLSCEGGGWRIKSHGKERGMHSLVIVAVGTGRDGGLFSKDEREIAKSPGYWEEPVNWAPGNVGDHLCIIGTGDGALMDLLRFKLRDLNPDGGEVAFSESGLLKLLSDWKESSDGTYASITDAIFRNEPFSRIQLDSRPYGDVFTEALGPSGESSFLDSWLVPRFQRAPKVMIRTDRAFLHGGASPLMRFLGYYLMEFDHRIGGQTIELVTGQAVESSPPGPWRTLVRTGSDRPLERILVSGLGGTGLKPLSEMAESRSAAQQFDFFAGHFRFPHGYQDLGGRRGLEDADEVRPTAETMNASVAASYRSALHSLAKQVQVPFLSFRRYSSTDLGAVDLPLLSAYVDLDAVWQPCRTRVERRRGVRAVKRGEILEQETAEKTRQESLLVHFEAIEEEGSGLWLLGEGGRGKSTILNFVALALADDAILLDDKPDDVRASVTRVRSCFKGRFPLLIRLRDLAGVDLGNDPDFRKILYHLVHRLVARGSTKRLKGVQVPSLQMLAATVPEHLRQFVDQGLAGPALLLVDGLDELPDRERKACIESLSRFTNGAGLNLRTILSTRTAAVQSDDWRALLQWPQAEIQPLNGEAPDSGAPSQQQVFASRYFRLLDAADPDDRAAELLVRAREIGLTLQDKSALTREPLLLASLVQLAHRQTSRPNELLPHSRAETLHAIIKLMLEDWDQVHHVPTARHLRTILETQGFGLDDCVMALRSLSFDALVAASTRLSRADLENRLAEQFQSGSGGNRTQLRMLAVNVAHSLLERLGILRSVGFDDSEVEFSAVMFRDFLAGVHALSGEGATALLDSCSAGTKTSEHAQDAAALGASALLRGLDAPNGPSNEPRWPRVWSVLGPLLDPPPAVNDPHLAARVQLACAILEELCPIERWENGRPPLEAWNAPETWANTASFAMINESLSIRVQAGYGRILGYLGDPRPGTGISRTTEGEPIPDVDWIEIPGGPFTMGSRKQVSTFNDELGQGIYSGITRPFRIGRFPITVRQFETFIAAGGYQDRGRAEDTRRLLPWWTAKGLEWKRSEDVQGPDRSRAVFQSPNHPQIGVSWYEALAFCDWLTGHLRRLGPANGGISPSQKICLPSEPEWERMARGGTVESPRNYAWGDISSNEDLNSRCNWDGTGLGATSPVGLFPRGKAECGASDVTGNVWEWTRSIFRKYPYDPLDGRENLEVDPDKRLVLRGGSWLRNDPAYLRAAFRFTRYPAIQDYRIGFRVVCVEVSR